MLKVLAVLVPYGVSTFLFTKQSIINVTINGFSSPTGYLHFYSLLIPYSSLPHTCSRPLRGIYISIRKEYNVPKEAFESSRPLRGIYISILLTAFSVAPVLISSRPLRGIYISIRHGVIEEVVLMSSRPLRGIYISIQLKK